MTRHDEKALAKLIGSRICNLRLERGWKQVDLEAYIDEAVKRASISDYETGRRMPSLRTLLLIAKAFEVEVSVLLLDPEHKPSHEKAVRVLSSGEGHT